MIMQTTVMFFNNYCQTKLETVGNPIYIEIMREFVFFATVLIWYLWMTLQDNNRKVLGLTHLLVYYMIHCLSTTLLIFLILSDDKNKYKVRHQSNNHTTEELFPFEAQKKGHGPRIIHLSPGLVFFSYDRMLVWET